MGALSGCSLRPHIVVFVRRFHPEECFLTPDLVVALDAQGPYLRFTTRVGPPSGAIFELAPLYSPLATAALSGTKPLSDQMPNPRGPAATVTLSLGVEIDLRCLTRD